MEAGPPWNEPERKKTHKHKKTMWSTTLICMLNTEPLVNKTSPEKVLANCV